MALIVANINRKLGVTDWKVGEVISTENITIDYQGTYCDEACRSSPMKRRANSGSMDRR